MKMIDIAKLAGVSIATVSRVINEPEKVKPETRERIQQLLTEHNFVANAVARGLVVNSMKTIGVLVVDIRDQYFSTVTYNIEREFTKLGYNVILSNTGGELGEKKRYLRVMLEKQVDGLILVGSVFKESSSNEHILAASETVPIVMVNSFLEGNNIYSVLCDDVQGIKDTVNYLVKQGHREIFYLNDIKSYSGLSKITGFKAGMKEHGLNEANIIELDSNSEDDLHCIQRFFAAKPKVSAIITGKDFTAIEVIKELNRLGYQVPADIAVVGYNNSIFAQIATPALTSVDNLQEPMAKYAVQILYNVLQKKQAPKKTVLSPNLIIRDSTNVTIPKIITGGDQK
jgi:LacI family transcriptional regulator